MPFVCLFVYLFSKLRLKFFENLFLSNILIIMTPVRIVFCLWISLFANTFLAFEIGSLSKYYINDKVRRVVDLRDSIVRENIIIKANNTRNMAMSDYYMAIPQTISSKLSSFQAHLKNEPDNLLQIQNLGLDRVT